MVNIFAFSLVSFAVVVFVGTRGVEFVPSTLSSRT
jgi:hypothetical protein